MGTAASSTPPDSVAHVVTLGGQHRKAVTGVRIARGTLAGTYVVVTVSEDRTFTVWLPERVGGTYSPSISQSLSQECSCLEYDADRRHVLIGLDNGKVEIVALSPEFLSFEVEASLHMHSKRVTAIHYDSTRDWILTVGRDKRLRVFNVRANSMFGVRCSGAWIAALAFDAVHARAFVAAYSGEILLYSVTDSAVQLLSTLSGHTGSVRALAYDAQRACLYSGSFDRRICCWDIGAPGREFLAKLTATLTGCDAKVKALALSQDGRTLFSAGDDSHIRAWDLVSFKQKYAWRGHTGSVIDLQCLQASFAESLEHLLVTASTDAKVKLWLVT